MRFPTFLTSFSIGGCSSVIALLLSSYLSGVALGAGEEASPSRTLAWQGAYSQLTYEIAEDEVELVRHPRGGLVEQKALAARGALAGTPGSGPLRVRLAAAAPQAQGYRARVREVELISGAEAQAVLYLPGQPRGRGQGAVLARNLIIRVDAGTDIAAVVHGLDLEVLRQASHDTRSWVCRATTDDPLAAPTVAAVAAEQPGIEYATPILRYHERERAIDPLLVDQTHLWSGVGGINAVAAWMYGSGLSGSGVVINIVDTGIEAGHPDIAPNLLPSAGFSYRENQQATVLGNGWTSPPLPAAIDSHGHVCAGLAAGRGDNGIGIAGVAYLASLVDVQLIGTQQMANPPHEPPSPYTGDIGAAAIAHNWNAGETAHRPWITSNSYGPNANYWRQLPTTQLTAFQNTALARSGRGIVHLFAIGNERDDGESQNMNQQQNNEYVISVAATDWDGRQAFYSNCSASNFVCAPGGISGDGIISTDRTGVGNGNNTAGDYTTAATGGVGTSWATPIVAGAVALMLEAQPDLTYRDVMHILAQHSDQTDPTNLGAVGPTYNDSVWDNWATNTAGVRYSNRYGFGKVNALNAVHAASNWYPVPVKATAPSSVDTTSSAIPDNTGMDAFRQVAVSAPTGFRVERVTLDISVSHTRWGDLSFYVRSPGGSWGTVQNRPNDARSDSGTWSFLYNSFWGESPDGTWTIYVHDSISGNTGTFNACRLSFTGYQESQTPVVTAASPQVILAGSTDTVVTLTGTQFVRNDPGDALTAFTLDGTTLPVSITSTTTAQVTIPTSLLATARSASLVPSNYSFSSQFTGTPGTVQAPSWMDGASFAIKVNGAPVATANTLSVSEDTTATGTLAGTDANGDALTYSVVSQGGKGTVTITNAATGAFSYAPSANATGADTFTFRATDVHGTQSSPATITVTIAPANDPPVLADLSRTVTTLGTISDTLAAVDVDGPALTYSLVSQANPAAGTFNLVPATGAFTYTSTGSAAATDAIVISVSDGSLNDVATMSITIVVPPPSGGGSSSGGGGGGGCSAGGATALIIGLLAGMLFIRRRRPGM
jgi:VCBS repeat-containing protein